MPTEEASIAARLAAVNASAFSDVGTTGHLRFDEALPDDEASGEGSNRSTGLGRTGSGGAERAWMVRRTSERGCDVSCSRGRSEVSSVDSSALDVIPWKSGPVSSRDEAVGRLGAMSTHRQCRRAAGGAPRVLLGRGARPGCGPPSGPRTRRRAKWVLSRPTSRLGSARQARVRGEGSGADAPIETRALPSARCSVPNLTSNGRASSATRPSDLEVSSIGQERRMEGWVRDGCLSVLSRRGCCARANRFLHARARRRHGSESSMAVARVSLSSNAHSTARADSTRPEQPRAARP